MHVKIYRPSKNAMQSGFAKLKNWVLEYELETARGPENLMGWTSSRDTLNQVKLKFESSDEAIEFAKNKGWDYTILPVQDRIIRPRNYVDNFKYYPPEEGRV